MPSLLLRRKKLVLACDVARMLRKPVGAEDFASYWTNKPSVVSITGALEKANQLVPVFFRWYYSRHELPSVRGTSGKLAGGCRLRNTPSD